MLHLIKDRPHTIDLLPVFVECRLFISHPENLRPQTVNFKVMPTVWPLVRVKLILLNLWVEFADDHLLTGLLCGGSPLYYDRP